jgi:hypothetical protein
VRRSWDRCFPAFAKNDLIILVDFEVGGDRRDAHGEIIEDTSMHHAQRIDAAHLHLFHDITSAFGGQRLQLSTPSEISTRT